jgi:arylsulfatase A
MKKHKDRLLSQKDPALKTRIKIIPWVVAGSMAGSTLASALQPVSARPNIVFILADDMGIGDCSVYNPASKIPTPNIDRLAKEGMLFTDAHAAGSICVPSRYGLLTGQYAFRTWNKFPPQFPNLHDAGRVTIASVLKSGGYDTAMVGKWHLGMQQLVKEGKVRYSPITVGFDYFFGMEQSLDTQPYYYAENDRMIAAPTGHTDGQQGDPEKVNNPSIQGPMWREGAMAPDFVHADCLPLLTGKAADYIKGRSAEGKPFFLYVALPAPHAPWLPLPEFQGKSGAGDYGDYTVQVDDSVRQVLEALEQQGLAENTLVIFTADNGPLWFRGDAQRYGHNAAGIYRGAKGDLYEGGHREPFVARWPGKIKPGSTSDQLVNFTDMMATFAEIAGVELPAGAGPDSFSMLPALLEKPATGVVRTNSVHENYGGASLALRLGDWKLCLPPKTYQIANGTITPGAIIDLQRLELYNLKNDPSEKTNLSAQNPEKTTELFALLKENVERGRSRPGGEVTPTDGRVR